MFSDLVNVIQIVSCRRLEPATLILSLSPSFQYTNLTPIGPDLTLEYTFSGLADCRHAPITSCYEVLGKPSYSLAESGFQGVLGEDQGIIFGFLIVSEQSDNKVAVGL